MTIARLLPLLLPLTATASPLNLLPRQDSSQQGTYTGPGDSGSDSSNVNTDAGASGGSSGSFNLSKGGIIAICVVVAFVVIFGVATTTLFIIAKRRQWDVRGSISRASRRMTGRPVPPSAQQAARRNDRQARRTGIQMTSTPAVQGHKRGLVIEVQDVEKGGKNGGRR